MALSEPPNPEQHKRQSREELLKENEELRRRITELEASRLQCASNEIAGTRAEAESPLSIPDCHMAEMADNIREVFWIFDWCAQKVIYASPAYETIWGRSVEDLYRRYEDWGNSIHPADRQFAEESFAKVLETGGGEPREYRIIRPDGSIRWISDRAYAVTNHAGEVCRITGVAEDITQRKKAEEAFKESQARLRVAIESLPFDFYILDNDGRYVMVNSACQENWGVRPGQCPEDVCADEATLALWKENNRRALAGEVVAGEVQLAPHGEPGYYYNIISPIRDGGNIRGILGVNLDVTALKQAEDALRESEQKFRNLAEQSPNMIFINQGGRVVYVNPKCQEYMGYTREEFLARGFDFLTLIAPEHRERLKENFSRHATGQDVGTVEYALYRRDGTRIEAILATKLIPYEGQRAILGTVTDVTALKQAEDALRRANDELEQRVRQRTAELKAEIDRRTQVEQDLRDSEEKYRTLVESAGDAISVVTTEGVLLFVNQTVGEHFQCAPEALIGKTMWDLFPKPVADVQMAHVRQVIRTGTGSAQTMQADVQGQLRWFNTTVEPLRASGRKDVALVLARDIDDLMQARKQLEEYRQQMTRADRLASLGTMSAMVAHELTQPLTVLRLSLQNAQETILTSDASLTAIEDLQSGIDEVATMARIIERFRGFARASSPIHHIDANLAVIARQMVDLTAEAAERARVSVSLQGLDTLPHISARPKDVEQLFFALMMNAIQAADGQKDSSVVVTGKASDGEIELSFADNCGGIAPENVEKIFKPFFTTKATTEGTGLGLCVVEHILDRYHGRIGVLNRPGEGVTFNVTLSTSASW